MPHSLTPAPTTTKQEILDRIRALAPRFGGRAEAAEEARRIPGELVQELLDAGIARILIPPRFGGYGLGVDTWFDVVREISKADASHGWCASLIIHHPHIVGMFPEEVQQAVWAEGPDVAIAASVLPVTQVTREDGGYRVSGQHSAFASGVGHSSWVIVGGFVPDGVTPYWAFFLIPPGEYKVRDTWFTAGMRATGSNTIITDNVFVPSTRVLSLSDLRDGKRRGAPSRTTMRISVALSWVLRAIQTSLFFEISGRGRSTFVCGQRTSLRSRWVTHPPHGQASRGPDTLSKGPTVKPCYLRPVQAAGAP